MEATQPRCTTRFDRLMTAKRSAAEPLTLRAPDTCHYGTSPRTLNIAICILWLKSRTDSITTGNCKLNHHRDRQRNSTMAQNLAPLSQPGLCIYSGFMAAKSESFVTKGRNAWSDRASYLISYSSPSGEALAPFLEIVEEKKKQISFKTTQGQEVMRIVKQPHTWSGTEYHGMRGEGNEVWHLKLKTTWSTEYRTYYISSVTRDERLNSKIELSINDRTASSNQVLVQNKVLGADKGILVNGQPAATMTRHEEWKHVHRMNIINVAPGMDILLALGVAWIRADKQKQDEKAAVSAAT